MGKKTLTIYVGDLREPTTRLKREMDYQGKESLSQAIQAHIRELCREYGVALEPTDTSKPATRAD